MSRAVLVYLQLIIPIAPVFSQRGQSLFAPGRVERQDQLGGVDSVFYLGERHMYGFPARLGQRLKPCEPRLEAFHSSVVREIVIPGVFAVVQFTDVVFEKPARPGDEIDDAQAFIELGFRPKTARRGGANPATSHDHFYANIPGRNAIARGGGVISLGK